MALSTQSIAPRYVHRRVQISEGLDSARVVWHCFRTGHESVVGIRARQLFDRLEQVEDRRSAKGAGGEVGNSDAH